jgi:hypothetical protein
LYQPALQKIRNTISQKIATSTIRKIRSTISQKIATSNIKKIRDWNHNHLKKNQQLNPFPWAF